MSEQKIEAAAAQDEQMDKRTRSMGQLCVWRMDDKRDTGNPQSSWYLVSGGATFADTRAALKWIDEQAGDGDYMIAREVKRVTVNTETVVTRKVVEVRP